MVVHQECQWDAAGIEREKKSASSVFSAGGCGKEIGHPGVKRRCGLRVGEISGPKRPGVFFMILRAESRRPYDPAGRVSSAWIGRSRCKNRVKALRGLYAFARRSAWNLDVVHRHCLATFKVRSEFMFDLLWIAIAVGFFALAALTVRACERI
jgi:hypothetical protein